MILSYVTLSERYSLEMKWIIEKKRITYLSLYVLEFSKLQWVFKYSNESTLHIKPIDVDVSHSIEYITQSYTLDFKREGRLSMPRIELP